MVDVAGPMCSGANWISNQKLKAVHQILVSSIGFQMLSPRV
jgi:hypothetical protein